MGRGADRGKTSAGIAQPAEDLAGPIVDLVDVSIAFGLAEIGEAAAFR